MLMKGKHLWSSFSSPAWSSLLEHRWWLEPWGKMTLSLQSQNWTSRCSLSRGASEESPQWMLQPGGLLGFFCHNHLRMYLLGIFSSLERKNMLTYIRYWEEPWFCEVSSLLPFSGGTHPIHGIEKADRKLRRWCREHQDYPRGSKATERTTKNDGELLGHANSVRYFSHKPWKTLANF